MAKVLVSLDDRLLARLDREARARGLSRSAFLSELVAREVGEAAGPGRSHRAREAMSRIQQLFEEQGYPEDPTTAIRRGRDAR